MQGVLGVFWINLGEICEVRQGHGTDFFNNILKETASKETNLDVGSGKKLDVDQSYCFSIIFKDDRAPLDLVAEDKTIRDQWVGQSLRN